MKKLGLVLFFTLFITSIYAQYSRPYRVAYNAAKKSYLITNRGDGKVLEMDSNYKVSTVITGLKDPRDLIVGSVGANKGLLLIDNNQVVVYDAVGYNRVIAFDISKATGMDIDDIEVDPRDPQYFYLSDVGANRIVKGKVGSPPFYTPSFTNLVTTGLSRPKGLTFNSKNELLVVTDDTAGKIYKIDTASGKLTKYMDTGLDSLNSIVQDNEGNYFITNWDDSYLYRCDKDFKNLKKLTSYNKPAGMAVNTDLDLLIVLCHFCNKMEFHKLHYFEPSGTVGACPGDSFDVNLSITADGIGTYNSGNSFVVEMSDNNGDFKKPITLGSVKQSSKPSSIRCVIPKGNYGFNHVYRIKSTSPEIYSSTKMVLAYTSPDFSNVVDKWTLCKGSEVKLGKHIIKNESGSWLPTTFLENENTANPTFTASDTGTFSYWFKLTNTSYGCVDSIKVEVDVNPDIELPNLKKSVSLCDGDTASIGVNNSPYAFTWSPRKGLTDSTSTNPDFSGNVNQRYFVNVLDTSTGCKGFDSVDVTVNPIPKVTILDSSIILCATDQTTFEVDADTGLKYSWSPKTYLNDSSVKEPNFTSTEAGIYQYALKVYNVFGCESSAMQSVKNNELPEGELHKISGTGNNSDNKIGVSGILPNNTKVVLYLMGNNGSAVAIDTFSSLPVMDYSMNSQHADTQYSEGFVKFISAEGCTYTSDTLSLLWGSVRNVFVSELKVFPNPTQNDVTIRSSSLRIARVNVQNIQGVIMQQLEPSHVRSEVNVSLNNYTSGVYIIEITDEFGLVYQKKILKID